ncbi:hypothetical protein BGZ61DRAFT_463708 [Ilyonectria robusta]|uniref:uncharacterized protein n=1 Tax=Ilyonectria robusta TaxID=1079257 RepID=UPI001E8D36B0|nr:uncharacterized protein BGZ61DRAFT_463708 [Ilyonectria robusta]KAH8661822.1 hypothetical protein BGZ61DRAFT_463708 [Ilyonectria robusta]
MSQRIYLLLISPSHNSHLSNRALYLQPHSNRNASILYDRSSVLFKRRQSFAMVNCGKCGYNNISKATTCAGCGEAISVVVKKVLTMPSAGGFVMDSSILIGESQEMTSGWFHNDEWLRTHV